MKADSSGKQYINAREEYIKLIKSELLGPGSEFAVLDIERELISSSPIGRYSIGILYPRGNQINHDNDETVSVIEADDAEPDDDTELTEVTTENEPFQTGNEKKHEDAFDETANETEDVNLDEEIGLSSQYMPSSMGITFIVKGDVDSVRGTVSFATYRRATLADLLVPYAAGEPDQYAVPPALSHVLTYDKDKRAFRLLASIKTKEVKGLIEKVVCSDEERNALRQILYRFAELCRSGHVREPHNKIKFTLDFSAVDYIDNNRQIDGTAAKVTALKTKLAENTWSLTVMFINDLEEVPARAHSCLYQPVLCISSADNNFMFVDNSVAREIDYMDDEEHSLELRYRDKKIYGTGLGVSVDWLIDDNGVGRLWSDFFPVSEVPPVSFDLPVGAKISSEHLSMKYLSDLGVADKDKKIWVLLELVNLYREWIAELKHAAKTIDSRFRLVAEKNILECTKACDRMYSGIETLSHNANAYKAFELANRAMFMQRVHLQIQRQTSDIDRYPGDEQIAQLLRGMDYRKEDDKDSRWRPFQLAFLLMDVNSIIDDESPERNIVDLIWFPTGGGKTEAYLGLTAFTIFYRHLTHPSESGGTAVIMRYTLRLLAAQQFTRAATLICACEYIRADSANKKPIYNAYPLGKEPITIGLWIGAEHTPNNNVKARENLEQLLKVTSSHMVRSVSDKHNKFQVLKCPWCGTKLIKDSKDKQLVGSWGYKMRDNQHFYISCTHEDCDFTKRLPVQIIDEELYQAPPSLLFATVDKFAMLPWDGRAGSFFALGNENRSPELIIQDELHLISGALGTIVGLYEAAIDALCSQKGVHPKIIASTATIRKAKEQCSVLYNRDVVQFPAPGINSGDSFFARELEIDYEKGVYGRKYIGLMPSGKTKAMMEIRSMAALLQQIYMMELPDEIKDKLWTLTVYFNSLRDLGKADTLVQDDVKDFIVRTANRMFSSRRFIGSADELTSRIAMTELNETLDKLEKLTYSGANKQNTKSASNVLLATNMISVGLDVARLNVMLMVGQPKLTSEYIQASSRIGRSYPGVAFVQFDATRNRDRSHYEQFKGYHESFYRFVEPTGATPFSRPARERALHAVVTSIIRHRTGLRDDDDAVELDSDKFSAEVLTVQNFIIDRIKGINDRADNGLEVDTEDVIAEIQYFINEWQEMADRARNSGQKLFFGRKFMVKTPKEEQMRLLRTYTCPKQDRSTETLTTMRDVDTQVAGKVLIWE